MQSNWFSFDQAEPIVTPFDEQTLEMMRFCKREGFPVCLREGLLRMFGSVGKKRLDSIIMNDTFENTSVYSPKDIWTLYEKYMERVANILGDDVAQVIAFESSDTMKSMLWRNCPLHERELERSVRSKKSMLA